MREIKFRAWQKGSSLHRKRGMYLVDDLVFHDQGGGGEAFLHLPGEESRSSEYFDDICLMQYTGLKDMHGVEIYEGDIIALRDVERNGLVIGRGVMFWSAKEACFLHTWLEFVGDECLNTWRPAKRLWLASDAMIDLEVIGNIYENPELLKESA